MKKVKIRVFLLRQKIITLSTTTFVLPTLNAVDREFESRSCQDSLNLYATLRRKSNDLVFRNQDNVSEYRSGATCVPVNCCFNELELKQIQQSVLVSYKADIILIISLNLTYTRHDIAEKRSFGVKQQSLSFTRGHKNIQPNSILLSESK